ncbi:hypothetical protein MMC11_001735 [Xylographa trunciseda]|nr:hypothetical protein [Xylographa trunciseda]
MTTETFDWDFTGETSSPASSPQASDSPATSKMSGLDEEFPCSLIISIPLPTHRLASSALRALHVDAELSPLVRRSFSLVPSDTGVLVENDSSILETTRVLLVDYKATTNRMLRVAVNGFMESLGVVLEVMEQLDADVL